MEPRQSFSPPAIGKRSDNRTATGGLREPLSPSASGSRSFQLNFFSVPASKSMRRDTTAGEFVGCTKAQTTHRYAAGPLSVSDLVAKGVDEASARRIWPAGAPTRPTIQEGSMHYYIPQMLPEYVEVEPQVFQPYRDATVAGWRNEQRLATQQGKHQRPGVTQMVLLADKLQIAERVPLHPYLVKLGDLEKFKFLLDR